MKKTTLTTASAVLGFAAFFSAAPTFATEQIAYALYGDPAYINSCSTCHSGRSGNESKGNLLAGVDAAYRQDKWNLSGLRAFVATSVTPTPTCTNGQVLNTATNTCVTPAPTCTNGQVLNTATNTCVTPVPVCSNGQVLNAAKTACETPVPKCVLPQVLNSAKNVCETPAPVVTTCTNGQVLNAATNTCVTPVPVCKSPQVLNPAKTACVTPTTTTPPTCVSPQVLNPAKTACVTPTTTTNTKPVLNTVAKQWDATVGELFTIPLSVNDAEQDEFTIIGKVTGSKLSAIHADAAGLPSIDFEWTPTAAQANKIFNVTFQAKETKTTQKLVSNRVSVKIRVWATGNRSSASVKTFAVTTSKFANGALNLSGKVTLNSILTVAEKKDFLAQKLDLTVSDKNGALVGSVPLTLSASGNWSATLPASPATCDIVLQYEGKNAARTVVGCTKPTTAITTPVTIANNSSNNPFTGDDDNEGDDDRNEHKSDRRDHDD